MIKIKNFNFNYGEKKILNNINFNVDEKTITSLIGPSGCGKSTLLRCINRMNDLAENIKIHGHIYYNDKDITSKDIDVTELRRKIGMVFQKPNPFPMSIYENIAYGLRIQGISDKKIIDETVKQSLMKADLYEEVKHRLNTSAFKLSGGQQQRLCIARALAIKPDVILLDEPCSALDPISTSKIESLLLKLKNECTIIIVTHNMQQARRVSDNTCYMLNGEVIEYSETQKLFDNPKNPMTRKYINGEFG